MNITLTDNYSLTTGFDVRDDSALGKAGLTRLVTTAKELFTEFDAPVDQALLKDVSLGATAVSPQLLSGDGSSLTLCGGVNCEVKVATHADGSLFGSNQFSIPIPIATKEAWVGVEVDLTAKVSASTAVSSVGIALAASAKLSCSTYSLFSGAAAPLPRLRDAWVRAFSNYSLTTSPESIRKQVVGTVNQTEASGSVSTTLALQLPYTVNPLASANLPFKMTASIQPSVTVQVAGSIKVSGDLLFRCFKKAEDAVQIGVYKKRGSTLSVSFTAGAGVSGEVGSTDVVGKLLNAVLPGVDTGAAGVTGDHAADLNGVIKDGLDRSLGVQLNANCSAALSDEAAVVYEIQLAGGDQAATDKALTLALGGDWTAIGVLPNARKLRNVTVETAETMWSMTLNLFGVYSATSVTDYVKSCTVLMDESGQVSMIDKLDASRISAQSAPYASDTQKLRQALMTDFLCTATYAAVAGKLGLKLAVVQSYLDYQRQMSPAAMQQNVQLGYELGLIPNRSLDAALAASPSLAHAYVSATVKYDTPALMDIFFSDADALAARTEAELEEIGRATMCDFLDPTDSTDAARIGILQNVQAWAAMDDAGSTANIERLPYFAGYSTPQIHAVEGDWVSIRWWADAVSQVAPALKATLSAMEAAPAVDPTKDTNFMKQRDRLAHVLGDVTRKTDAAFVHGWGEAVMFTLSGRHGNAAMDLAWNSNKYHYGGQAQANGRFRLGST